MRRLAFMAFVLWAVLMLLDYLIAPPSYGSLHGVFSSVGYGGQHRTPSYHTYQPSRTYRNRTGGLVQRGIVTRYSTSDNARRVITYYDRNGGMVGRMDYGK